MKYGLIIAGAAAILSGCCSCPQPCPWLKDKPEGAKCPEGGLFCECKPWNDPDPVVVTDVRRSKTNDGFARVQVFLTNYAGDRVRIRYRFNWVNNDGVEVRDPDHDAWENLTIGAGDDATLTTIAPTKNCCDFKLMKHIIQ